MFYPERITSISPSDRVLEIGPGADPHPRSNIFLELSLPGDDDYAAQFGHNRKLQTDKQVVFYDGTVFPFKDKEFDYVICSHVLEHVVDVNLFLSEIFRVSKRGYLEYPLITYEYLYNFEVHKNFLKWNGVELFWLKKEKTNLKDFIPVQLFFTETLRKGYTEIINGAVDFFIEGFEWERPFEIIYTEKISDVSVPYDGIPEPKRKLEEVYSYRNLIGALYRKITR
jgi:SAM-dependent methyltransferase